jgi:hypothetical protein
MQEPAGSTTARALVVGSDRNWAEAGADAKVKIAAKLIAIARIGFSSNDG